MLPSDAHRDESPFRGRGLAFQVLTPADERSVGHYAASICKPCADGDEFPIRRSCERSASVVVAPAGDGAVGPHSAGISPAGVYGGELSAGRSGLPVVVSPQQATVPSALTPQVWSSPALTEENRPSGEET